MKHTVTVVIDTDTLRTLEDSQIAALWAVSQVNPAPRHDYDACRLVRDLSQEIVRRWLERAPQLQYEQTADGYLWDTLRRNGHWPGPTHDTWVYEPGKAEREAAEDEARAARARGEGGTPA